MSRPGHDDTGPVSQALSEILGGLAPHGAGEEQALAREELPLEAAGQPAGHLDVHRDITGNEHHRASLRSKPFTGLKGHDHGGRLAFANCRLHHRDANRSTRPT